MKKAIQLPLPAIKALRKLGSDLRDARLRRRLPLALMAQRAGVSLSTIRKIEKGDPTASMGGYAAVLFSLGMLDRLGDLADGAHDLTGRRLEEERLPQRVRLPRKAKQPKNHE